MFLRSSSIRVRVSVFGFPDVINKVIPILTSIAGFSDALSEGIAFFTSVAGFPEDISETNHPYQFTWYSRLVQYCAQVLAIVFLVC